MRYMANSRIQDGVPPEQLAEFFSENAFSTTGWDLVRHRIVTEYAFKVGDQPGIVLFLEVESSDEAAKVLNALPVVQQGLITFDLDPLGKTMRL